MAHDGQALPVLETPARPSAAVLASAALAPNVYDAEPIPEAARAEIDRLLQSGDLFRYTAPEGAPVALLEAEFAAMLGSRYALAVASCSAALFLTLKALDLPRGARVLIPAFTFAAVPSAVVHADCVPVLVEVGQNYRIDMADFEAKLDGSIAAVLISHMRGHTSDMDGIMALCNARGIPVIEDAAHSLGTLWNGRPIGTIGKVGCFSFQSYKMINAGEGGIMVTDDPEIAARAVIMSGAYEANWKKHPGLQNSYHLWQNRLPLYNTRMQNLSAAVIRPQLGELDRRVRDGRAGHDHVAERLNTSPWLSVPPALPQETRAPDSIQFNLVGFDTDAKALAFQDAAKARGISVQVFGLSENNARAFWNWQFLDDLPELPKTRAMLMRACDVRLPARLTRAELDFIADALIDAAAAVRAD
ncbi:aminotransferase class I/II-fold pyridoxal phosphate-dependent enzyme [Frigidibacter albus]|uniref:Aminotransferase class I/II-fold pyridoxal phosphate-dependent enzyme n=1 Tax=Frigidibacter albus TaxID=1465486 RepID=A0A6L8VHS8_9RHOB|nr:aminotransferase class I/II-fold pyridoxal phosphate-dependent enzyme [Frigidibacter albus]MZQ89937.1 aminotransferase class I/II-fold pyridoxal phosphate-dependent enzyme [Frigidibacter albus]NBE31688.1 aminotransferase class I/II-fold pyridoxal phosphate-dependent enzyme [Frigidibacter albus]GGH55897.1 aminotransferase DegT [Frigidibacter albus]